VAVQTSRFDLDAWLAAFRAAPVSPLALNLEVAADAASFRGVSLRRLRGGISREGARLTLSDVAMLLPGDAELELEGTTAGARLELAARAAGPNLRETLLALGLPLEAVDAGRLRRFEARGRLALAEAEIGVSDLAASVDGTRMTGAVAFRPGARPHLGIGIELDRVELDGLLPAPPSPAALAAIGLDANLRITAGRVRLREVVLEPLALDAALENGRLLVRRLATRMRGADIAAAGVLSTAPAPRLSDASAEVTAADARGLLALLPAAWRPAEGFGAQPVALRLALSGAPEALGVRAEGQLGDLRIEAEGQLDLPQRRLAGTTQLHHPGAQRLIALAHGQEPPHWLGAGSFSLIASLSLSPEAWNAESFALVAGELRADGRASLAWGGARPRLTGRLRFDILPLPDLAQDAAAPLGLERLGLADAELAIEAGRIQGEGLPPVADLRGGLTLTDGTLHLAWTEGRLHGGPMEGALRIAGLAQPPRVEGHVTVAGLVITGPLLGLPLDLSAGVLDGALEGRATGHSLTALLGTLSGEARMVLRDGVLRGVALAAVPAVADLPDAAAAEAALRLALEGGATALDRLDAPARLADGRAMIETARLVAQGGTLATLGGVVDLARGSLDLTLRVAMPGEAPDVGLRITGPVATPRRLPDLSPWLRWRAER
ncbi:MAG TPA: AsmA-like C-terminal region-containing protein, partial [Acetobacteraceae bacterium]|nr:AsmA-like C-terminal region-containing protein [Acetobacteraceae bacterium]